MMQSITRDLPVEKLPEDLFLFHFSNEKI